MEKTNFASPLKEKDLTQQIGEATLGDEIRKSVDGKAGIQNPEDRKDLSENIEGANAGWHGVQFGKQMV